MIVNGILARGLNTLAGGQPLWTCRCRFDGALHRSLNTLAGGQPLWTLAGAGRGWDYGIVSIPSQVGNLFGRCDWFKPDAVEVVSIPSQMGNLFGLGERRRIRIELHVSIPSQVGNLFGHNSEGRRTGSSESQYPRRWATSLDEAPLRVPDPRVRSQYPRRWATSLDTRTAARRWSGFSSQYPRRWATSLDGLLLRLYSHGVSLNTLAGGQPLWTPANCHVKLRKLSLNTLAGGQPLWT